MKTAQYKDEYKVGDELQVRIQNEYDQVTVKGVVERIAESPMDGSQALHVKITEGEGRYDNGTTMQITPWIEENSGYSIKKIAQKELQTKVAVAPPIIDLDFWLGKKVMLDTGFEPWMGWVEDADWTLDNTPMLKVKYRNGEHRTIWPIEDGWDFDIESQTLAFTMQASKTAAHHIREFGAESLHGARVECPKMGGGKVIDSWAFGGTHLVAQMDSGKTVKFMPEHGDWKVANQVVYSLGRKRIAVKKLFEKSSAKALGFNWDGAEAYEVFDSSWRIRGEVAGLPVDITVAFNEPAGYRDGEESQDWEWIDQRMHEELFDMWLDQVAQNHPDKLEEIEINGWDIFEKLPIEHLG